MKTRNSLVSNSSSSSFVCCICGGIEAATDDQCMSDFDMDVCINRHEIHNDCKKQFSNLTINDCPICSLQALTDYEELQFMRKLISATPESNLEKVQSLFKTYFDFRKYLDPTAKVKE